MFSIPNSWPAEFRPALETVAASTCRSSWRTLATVVAEFCAWSSSQGETVNFNIDGLRGFRHHLYGTISTHNANWRIRLLYRVGILGPVPEIRDWLFENFMDTRSVEEVVSSRWWPRALRALALSMEIGETRRVVLELDNYLRCLDRVGRLPEHRPLEALFLAEGLTDGTRYQRLLRLCVGLEILRPGTPDLIQLRTVQRQFHPTARPPVRTVRPSKQRIPEVETLLSMQSNPGTGMPYAEATLRGRRAALNVFHDVLNASGRPLAFDKESLDLFADHARRKYAEWCNRREGRRGWNLRSVGTRLYQLGPFIPSRSLRRDWNRFAESFFRLARKHGEPKTKERALAKHPMDLPAFFRSAVGLLEQAEITRDVQTRHTILTVIGSLGVLLFYPLRRTDLLRLRWGRELRRDAQGWLLALGCTQKTGTEVQSLRLPNEAIRFLDACLLGGLRPDSLFHVYHRRRGDPVLRSPVRHAPYNADAFTEAFRRWVGHSPHLLRSVWCDELVARGADSQLIACMLQHRSLISQAEYEILASKIRRIQAVATLAEISEAVLAS